MLSSRISQSSLHSQNEGQKKDARKNSQPLKPVTFDIILTLLEPGKCSHLKTCDLGYAKTLKKTKEPPACLIKFLDHCITILGDGVQQEYSIFIDFCQLDRFVPPLGLSRMKR